MRTLAATVFSCGASRNKRNGELLPEPIGDLEPGLGHGCSIQILRATRPAPGFRSSHTGALLNVGYGGYNWSPAVSESLGVYLLFSATELDPGNAYRGTGLQLRCLSE